MPNSKISAAVLLGCATAVTITSFKKNEDYKKPEPDAYSYGQFGTLPDFWHDMNTDPFFSNTWRHVDLSYGHVISVANETAYLGDSPADYYFPTGTEQWEPDALLFLGESIGEALGHHHVQQSLIERLGMTEAPEEDSFLQVESSLGWDNKPWKEYIDPALKGYQWDQSSIPKIYKVADSASYLKPYNQRDHSWNDAEYNQSDEVKFLDNTKTLNADYLENLAPAAEYHLREGRTGVAAEDEV